MPDETDFSAAAEKIKELFSNDEGKEQLQNIINMIGNNGKEQEDAGESLENMEMLMKIKKVMSIMEKEKTSEQAVFLNSLGGFLSPQKQQKLNKASKLLSLGRVIEVFKDI